MRYRIQVEPMLGCTLMVVTELSEYGGRLTADSKMYTLDGEVGAHGGLVELLGELQRLVAESAL
jgi:hypothetical protein